MPHFFLHLHQCGSVTPDAEGSVFENAEAARVEAIRAARDLMRSELYHGHLCLGCHIEVENAEDASIFVVRFRDAVVVTGG